MCGDRTRWLCRQEHKIRCPDYQGCDADAAFRDFSARIANYKKAYETLSLDLDRELTFIRVSNITQFHINNVNCNVQSKSAYFLMNLRPHIMSTLYFTRHGESMFNTEGKIGGDAGLSENGKQYAAELGKFVEDNGLSDIPVWTSLMKRTQETGSYLPNTNVMSTILSILILLPLSLSPRFKVLNELDAGQCDGMTYQEIEDKYPEEFALRDLDKFNYRYPRGESYHDLCCRLEPIIMDLEKQRSVMVICHQAVLRCVVGYLLDIPVEDMPYIKTPLHTIFQTHPPPIPSTGDAGLSENGKQYAAELGKFVEDNGLSDIPVWTSLMKRTQETGSYLPNTNVMSTILSILILLPLSLSPRFKVLNELDAGQCDGMTYQEIEDKYPEEFALRDLDKFNYRYPRGESYHDLCCRLEPIIMDLEKQRSVMVICHQAVLRCVVGYLLDIPVEDMPYIKTPLHTVVKITPTAYGCEREDIKFGVAGAATRRDKQTVESIEQRLLKSGISKVGSTELWDSNGHNE
eukprot:sb/3463879/